MHRLVITRFNNETYKNNVCWRQKHKWKGAAYGSPRKVTQSILPDAILFVLEMHLDENKIKGVGMIKNKVTLNKHFKIYKWGNYNRYTYSSNYRIDRNNLSEDEKIIFRVLDELLFKRKSHCKRGQGIGLVPTWIMSNNVINFVEEFRNMFLSRWKNSIDNECYI